MQGRFVISGGNSESLLSFVLQMYTEGGQRATGKSSPRARRRGIHVVIVVDSMIKKHPVSFETGCGGLRESYAPASRVPITPVNWVT